MGLIFGTLTGSSRNSQRASALYRHWRNTELQYLVHGLISFKTRAYRLHAMGIIETNEPGVVRCMQCQAVPDAVRSVRRYGDTRNLHLDPVACIILNFNMAIQAKQIFQTNGR